METRSAHLFYPNIRQPLEGSATSFQTCFTRELEQGLAQPRECWQWLGRGFCTKALAPNHWIILNLSLCISRIWTATPQWHYEDEMSSSNWCTCQVFVLSININTEQANSITGSGLEFGEFQAIFKFEWSHGVRCLTLEWWNSPVFELLQNQ